MSEKILINRELFVSEMRKLLAGLPKKKVHMRVNRNKTKKPSDDIFMVAGIESLPGEVKLEEALDLNILPATLIPAFQLHGYLHDQQFFWGHVLDTINHALLKLTFICQPPEEEVLEAMIATDIENQAGLAELALNLTLETKDGLYATYTEDIRLKRLLSKERLADLWLKIGREETWRDRPSLLL